MEQSLHMRTSWLERTFGMLLLTGVLLCATQGFAAEPVPAAGVYAATDNNYRIEVEFLPGILRVTEPNLVSEYKQRPGTQIYELTINGTLYALQIIDGETLSAFKPGTNFAPTALKRVGAGAAPAECKAEAVDVNGERLWVVNRDELDGATIAGRYLEEGKGPPIIELKPGGVGGVFETYGAPAPDHVYAIKTWAVQANCDGSLLATVHPRASTYVLILKLEKPYQGSVYMRSGLNIFSAADGDMSIYGRRKAKR